MIIFDTNILSMFAKIDKVDLLLKLSDEIVLVPEIKRELSVPLEYGKNWPEKILNISKTIYPNEKEQRLFEEFLSDTRRLGSGELQALAVCKIRGYIFCSFDRVALNFARKKGIKCMNLHDIFRELLRKDVLTSDDITRLVREIEAKDNVKFKNIGRIFEIET